jgi:GrpB-like predicted nucleotidyltransferase (UPF0157 family)
VGIATFRSRTGMTMSEGSDELGLRQGQVRLCEPTPHWIALFEEEASRLSAALRPFEAAVEHCGSTSIPGVPAKPILDILVGIPQPLDVAPIRDALAPLGYEHATWAGVPGHEVFGKGDPRTHLVHVVPLHGSAWDRMIGFRDALRMDASLAAEYGELKRQLAARFPDNRAAYTDGKAHLVARVLAGR